MVVSTVDGGRHAGSCVAFLRYHQIGAGARGWSTRMASLLMYLYLKSGSFQDVDVPCVLLSGNVGLLNYITARGELCAACAKLVAGALCSLWKVAEECCRVA